MDGKQGTTALEIVPEALNLPHHGGEHTCMTILTMKHIRPDTCENCIIQCGLLKQDIHGKIVKVTIPLFMSGIKGLFFPGVYINPHLFTKAACLHKYYINTLQLLVPKAYAFPTFFMCVVCVYIELWTNGLKTQLFRLYKAVTRHDD